jgi:Flp pilus assembly protein TadG
MKVIKKIKGHLAGSSGQVIIIAALLITAIIGMAALVVDMGSLYEDRRSLQAAADAAALAGAQELPDTIEAEQEAQNNISSNYNDTNYTVEVGFDSYMGIPDTMIIVTVTNPDSSIIFGRIFGSNSANVKASATAVIARPVNITNVVPWGVKLDPGEDWDDWLTGQTEKTLKYGPQSYEKNEGNFYALDLDPNVSHSSGGANEYYPRIVGGYDGDLEVGDWIWTEPGNMGKTETKVYERLAKYGDGEIHDFDTLVENGDLIEKNGQVVMVPVIHTLENPHGEEKIQILAFAPFIITEVNPDGGNKGEIKGRFVSNALIVTEGGVEGFEGVGLKVVRLIK